MGNKSQVAGAVVAGFPSPAEQYLEPPLDLNELLVKRPAATFFFVALEPANPNYPTITITPGHELLTFGKVTAVIHRL